MSPPPIHVYAHPAGSGTGDRRADAALSMGARFASLMGRPTPLDTAPTYTFAHKLPAAVSSFVTCTPPPGTRTPTHRRWLSATAAAPADRPPAGVAAGATTAGSVPGAAASAVSAASAGPTPAGLVSTGLVPTNVVSTRVVPAGIVSAGPTAAGAAAAGAAAAVAPASAAAPAASFEQEAVEDRAAEVIPPVQTAQSQGAPVYIFHPHPPLSSPTAQPARAAGKRAAPPPFPRAGPLPFRSEPSPADLQKPYHMQKPEHKVNKTVHSYG